MAILSFCADGRNAAAVRSQTTRGLFSRLQTCLDWSNREVRVYRLCEGSTHYALRSLGGHVSCPSFSPPSPGRLVVPSPSTVSATEREFASSPLYLNAARPRGIPAVDKKASYASG